MSLAGDWPAGSNYLVMKGVKAGKYKIMAYVILSPISFYFY